VAETKKPNHMHRFEQNNGMAKTGARRSDKECPTKAKWVEEILERLRKKESAKNKV